MKKQWGAGLSIMALAAVLTACGGGTTPTTGTPATGTPTTVESTTAASAPGCIRSRLREPAKRPRRQRWRRLRGSCCPPRPWMKCPA